MVIMLMPSRFLRVRIVRAKLCLLNIDIGYKSEQKMGQEGVRVNEMKDNGKKR
jgi:hypothetical protein